MTKNIILGILNILVKVAVLCVAVYLLIYGGRMAFNTGYSLMVKEPSSDVKIIDVDVEIPEGSSTETIANILNKKGLIGSTYYFRIMAKLSGYDNMFQYGDYTFNTGMSEEDIMLMLLTAGAKRETVTFTIPEGYTIEQIAVALDEQGICNGKDFLEVVYESNFGYEFIEQIPERNIKLQGYMFPDTYEVYADADAEDIASTMLKQFENVFTDEYYKRAEELGLTLDEVITIASIIEREVVVDEERAKVAGVIYNRLENGMNLEMCSTVMYALGKTKDRLLFTDLEIDSKYNTYLYPGLPIGPIANPGEASIKAVLYPEEHDYLFFVLVNEETGEHEFNERYEDHIAAMRRHNQDF